MSDLNEQAAVEVAEVAEVAPAEQAAPEAPAQEELQAVDPKADEMRIMTQFGISVGRINSLTMQMSTRQMARVLRAVVVAPLYDETSKFVDAKEHELFKHIAFSSQLKMALINQTLAEMDKEYGSVTPPPVPSGEETKGEETNG